MRNVFLGKWWHWLLLAAATVLLWQAGKMKLHVVYFNTFVLLLLAGTVALLLILLLGTKPGERVTRDDLEEVSQDQSTPDGE